MTTSWQLQRAYAAHILPGKGADPALLPECYWLKLESEFRDVVIDATISVTRTSLTSVVFKMADDRSHPVREMLVRLAFGQTRSPLAAVRELASRLSEFTDRRTGSSLMLTTVEEARAQRRVAIYVFPEQDTFTLNAGGSDEAFLQRLRAFVASAKLRKVARFEGKNIKSHFVQGEVADFLIGSDPKGVADYWVTSFLDAEFAINDKKGTSLVAAGLKAAFDAADPDGKQAVMEAAVALMVDSRSAWSIEQIAKRLPQNLQAHLTRVAPNNETRMSKFKLDKELLKQKINYRVFQLKTGVWVSSPFAEVGQSVTISGSDKRRVLSCKGEVIAEKVQRDKSHS